MSADILRHEHTYNKIGYCTECLIKKGETNMKTKYITTKCAKCESLKLEGVLFCQKHLKSEYDRYLSEGDNMKTENEVTPLKVGLASRSFSNEAKGQGMFASISQDGVVIAYIPNGPEAEGNAAVIIRSVNSHEALLKAAKLSLAMIKDRFPYEHGMENVGLAWGACEKAIKLAEGKI